MACARSALFVVGSLLVLLAGTVHGEDAKMPRTDLYGDPLPPGAVMRLGTIRLRHAGADVVFSKDGKQLISFGFYDDELRVWDVVSGKMVRRKRLAGVPHRFEHFGTCALSPDGATAATLDARVLHLFDTRTGAKRARLTADEYSPLLLFSPDGKFLLLQRKDKDDKNVLLWDIAGGKKRIILKETDFYVLKAAAFSSDSRQLAGIDDGGNLYHWDTKTGRVLKKADKMQFVATDAAFSPAGKTLAVSVKNRNAVLLLEASTLKRKAVRKAPANVRAKDFYNLAFSPDGRWLAATYGTQDDSHRYMAPTPDGRVVQATAEAMSATSGAVLWDVTGSKEPRQLPERPHSYPVFSPDSKTLLYHDYSQVLRLWDVVSGRPLHQRSSHAVVALALAVSPNGKTIASGDYEGALRLWDAATSKPLHVLQVRQQSLGGYFFSADSRRMISASVDGAFQVWDVAAGKEVRRFEVNWPKREGFSLFAAQMSPDGARVAAIASDNAKANAMQLFAWETATGKRLLQRPYHLETRSHTPPGSSPRIWHVAHAAFATDGERVSVWLGDRVGIEEIATGSLLAKLPKGVGRPIVFSPDGRLLAAGIAQPKNKSEDNRKGVSLIEAASGEEIVQLNTGVFTHFAFAPDGRSLVSADKTSLRVWDTWTGERLHQIAWPENVSSIHALAVLPGGRAATAMPDGDVLVWDPASSTWPQVQPMPELGRKELDALWSDLASDARTAYRAVVTLTTAPAQAVSYLSDRLRPMAPDDKRIAQLLADLDSDSFSTREAATRELTRLHYRAEPMLRRALEGKPSLETRRRLKDILSEPRRPGAEALRTLRALAVLERIGTPEARRLLEKLAGGAAAPETRAAQAALQRLNCCKD